MTFDEFEEACLKTVIYADDLRIIYPALGLAGEVGEVTEKIKKVYRDDAGKITPEKRQAIAKELGDVLWYVAALCRDLDIKLVHPAECVLEKLESRKARGVLGGSGDER